MKELAIAYLRANHTQSWDWTADQSAYNLFVFLYQDGLSVGDYKPYITIFHEKPIAELTLTEVKAYLTMLAKHDRVSDCYSSAIENGTLAALLNRFLALEA